MQATIKKTATLQDVISVAEEMMFNFNGTTTLEVKNELRNRGYWATQQEISQLLIQAYKQQDWDFTEKQNGIGMTYRVYTLKDTTTIPTSVANMSAKTNSGKVVIGPMAYVRRNGQTISALDKSEAETEDWEVSSVINNDVLYFDASFSRDDVRNAYRGIVNVNKDTVRARRIK